MYVQVQHQLPLRQTQPGPHGTKSSWSPVTTRAQEGQHWVQSSSTFSLVNWIKGQQISLGSLLMTQNWEEWLIHERVVLPFRGTLTGWRNGLREANKSQQGESIKSRTRGGMTPCTSTCRQPPSWRPVCREGPGDPVDTKVSVSQQCGLQHSSK